MRESEPANANVCLTRDAVVSASTLRNLSRAVIWSFPGLPIGLLIAALCGSCGAMCAGRCMDSKVCLTGKTEASSLPHN